MIVRPTISLTPCARRYGGSSTLLIVSLMNMPLKIKRTFGGARGRFFSKAPAACLPAAAVAVGLVARCLAQKRYNFYVGVPLSAV
jgi:hypothetical protein